MVLFKVSLLLNLFLHAIFTPQRDCPTLIGTLMEVHFPHPINFMYYPQ